MLDSKHKSGSIIECGKIIPLDKEAKDGIPEVRDLPFQTKTDIYDRKCNKCGFARIEVIDSKGRCEVFNDIYKAIDNAEVGDYLGIKEINRTCEYPGNIEETCYGNIYPTMTEIVMNGCMLWDKKNYPVETNETLEILTLVENEQIKVPDRQIS